MNLFEDNGRYTEEGNRISNEIEKLVTPLLEEYVNRGYKNHELEFIACRALSCKLIMLGYVRQMKIREAEEEAE